MGYVTYNNFKLGPKTVTGYKSIFTQPVITGLIDIKERCEKREKNFYYHKHGKRNELPSDWKSIVKQDIQGEPIKKDVSIKKIGANAYLNSTDYDTFKAGLLEGFKGLYLGQLTLFDDDDISKALDNSIARLYKTLNTRTQNQTLKVTKKTISGDNSSMIEGWLIEIMQGVLDRKKLSTSNFPNYSVIADYIVEGVGLEETKRGLSSTNTITDSVFHIGSFTTTSILYGRRWSNLQDVLVNAFVNIMATLSTNTSTDIRTLRRQTFDALNVLVISYLGARLLSNSGGLSGLKHYQEVFYFGSGSTVLLASEFIEGVLKYSKLSSGGYAELSDSIGYGQLSKMGLESLIKELKADRHQMGMNFTPQHKAQLETYIRNQTGKMGPYFKKGNFDLWYGK